MPEIWLVLKHHYSCQMVEWRLPPHVFPSLESRLQAFLFDNLSKNVSATDRRCGSKKTCRVWTQAVFLYSLHNNLYHCRTIFCCFMLFCTVLTKQVQKAWWESIPPHYVTDWCTTEYCALYFSLDCTQPKSTWQKSTAAAVLVLHLEWSNMSGKVNEGLQRKL